MYINAVGHQYSVFSLGMLMFPCEVMLILRLGLFGKRSWRAIVVAGVITYGAQLAFLWSTNFWFESFWNGTKYLVTHPDVYLTGMALFMLVLLTVLAVALKELDDGMPRIVVLACVLGFTILAYATFYAILGICTDSDCSPGKIRYDFVSGLYFSIVTFTTTGYGDYHPQDSGRLLAASEALAGYIFFGLFVSLLSSFIARHDAQRRDG
jgi:voltage-gated potassium channel Kch